MNLVNANLLGYSEDFTKWNAGVGASVVRSTQLGPLYGRFGCALTFAAVADAAIYQSETSDIGNDRPYVGSVWLKANAPTTLNMQLISQPSLSQWSQEITFNVTDDWQRFSFPVRTGGITSDTGIRMYLVTRDSVARLIEAFGAMLSPTEVLTPYLPTLTAAAVYVTDPSVDNSVVGLVGQDTLLLDIDSWDLCVDANGNIAVAKDPYSMAQDVASAIKLFKGELYYDTSRGVPYLDGTLGDSPPISLLKAQMEDAAKSVPGVVDAKCTISDFSNRKVSGTVAFTTVAGTTGIASF